MGQINLNNFKVITDKLNTFFVDNKFMVASEIPTEGEFKVGDIIINNGPTNVAEPMWICIEAGNPGTWTVFNSGGGSGGGKLTTARNRVVLNAESKSEVSIGVSGFNKASGVLMVFTNSRFMTEGVDYEINADSTKIIAIGGAWNEELASDYEIEFVVFKMMGEEGVISSVNELVKLKNTVIVNQAVNEVEIGIDGFNEGDDLTVYRNSVYMIEGVDYKVQGNKIVSLKGNWNAEGGSDYKFTFEVLKTVAKVNPDAVVGMENLTEDVKEAIEAAGNIDLNGKQDKTDNGLATTDKTIVGAINELFQSANNGKELIANAIGEPLSSNDTFSAMSDDINSLLSTFKTNMMNNGISVEGNDKFKQLIEKLALLADSEGKGIQVINATGNNTKSGKIIIDNLSFKPILVVFKINTQSGTYPRYYYTWYSSLFPDYVNGSYFDAPNPSDNLVTEGFSGGLISLIDNGFTVGFDSSGLKGPYEYYAIGVGEEDTTLRDSLASILQDEGVVVVPEDEMPNLITKTDTEFANKNTKAENTRSTLANLMTEGSYDITGEEDIDTLLGLLTASGIKLDKIKQIACGESHTFILKTDGSLWACGLNSNGQLGLGHNTNHSTFIEVTTNINNDVKQVACDNNYTFILKKDGSLWSCGYNYYGQLGLGDTEDRNTFTKVNKNINNDVKQIACGFNHIFILKNDGSVWACGYNYYGQLGLGTSGYGANSTFTKVNKNINNDVKQIACGYDHTFILKNDGSIWACGKNDKGQLGLGASDNSDHTTFTKVATNINNDVKQIACGDMHTFILKNDGSVWACGSNSYGGLGLGNTLDKHTFTKVTTNINNDVKEIVCEYERTFILKNDGSVWACGDNTTGELGLGENNVAYIGFTKVNKNINNDVKQIACGNYHTVILKNDSSVYSCGYNINGQLGVGDYTEREIFFTQIPKGLSY